MIQFFAPDIENLQVLPKEESQHCIRVLRHKENDEINVIDGRGKRYLCRIIEADPREVRLEIISSEIIHPSWEVEITLAVAPTKNMDRMEWLMEKAVEIGINKFVPLLCEHSERKNIKTERLLKIAIAAMKQSLKTSLPEITELTPLRDFVRSDRSEMKFMGYCDKDYPLRNLLAEYQPGKSVAIMIGPEGDFSPAEVRLCVENNFIPVTFGNNRLRTETAGLVGLETIHIINDYQNLKYLKN